MAPDHQRSDRSCRTAYRTFDEVAGAKVIPGRTPAGSAIARFTARIAGPGVRPRGTSEVRRLGGVERNRTSRLVEIRAIIGRPIGNMGIARRMVSKAPSMIHALLKHYFLTEHDGFNRLDKNTPHAEQSSERRTKDLVRFLEKQGFEIVKVSKPLAQTRVHASNQSHHPRE